MFAQCATIVLHPRYVDEIKNHPNLSFDEANKKVSVPSIFLGSTADAESIQSFFGSKIPGFEPFDGIDKEGILLEVINKKLTHTLGMANTSIGP